LDDYIISEGFSRKIHQKEEAMSERFDWNKIPTKTIEKNLRKHSIETAHLKDILESYERKDNPSSSLLADLEGLLWEDRMILDGQIRLLRKRQGVVTNCDSTPGECPFHGKNNKEDPRRVIVKIDVKDIKKAIGHLEEIIEKYRNRKHLSSGLLTMFEWFLSEYRNMID